MPGNDEGRPAGGPRALTNTSPADASAANRIRANHDQRPAVRLGSKALARLHELELAIDELAACEPRGWELASVVWLALERLDRHHRRPHQALFEEHLAA